MKIAVLGGGMGGMTAAWVLSGQGHEVTVYQRGWRLGGKGASGRNADIAYRIEEHGLHVLMGFYDHAMSLLQKVYTEAAGVAYPNGSPLPWLQALTPWDTCVFSREISNDKWSFFDVTFPPRPGNPWDPPRQSPDYTALVIEATQVMGYIFTKLSCVSNNPVVAGLVGTAIQLLVNISGAVSDSLRKAILDALCAAVTEVVKLTPLLKSDRDEWLFIGFCFVAGNLLGMLEDDLVQPQPDFDKINDEDYRAWLGEALDSTGCPEWASRQSPLVIALYDLAFSRPTTLAAGVTLNVVLRLGLDYRGHLAWKMNAGMGDVVFAPLFIALQARKNVTFNFFHRVIKLGLDAAKQRVETIELEQQVALAAPYDPLIDVGGLACWPNEPKAALLPASYQADRASQQKMPYDFEHDPPGSNKYTAGPLMLTRGSEFDVVVLAISIGAFDDVANDLKLPGSKFAAMVDGLKTMRTQALQVWLGVNFQQLGSPAPAGMVISYYEPFNSWSDMSQVLNKEQWGFVPVHNISYFCDALPDDLVSDAAAAAFVAQNATQFLQHDVTPLWPGFVGVNEISRLPRANVDKSDRYVLSEAGSIGKRLAPYDSGFINLALAGDWVHTTLNAGCLEAATLGGLGAADAILSGKVTP